MNQEEGKILLRKALQLRKVSKILERESNEEFRKFEKLVDKNLKEKIKSLEEDIIKMCKNEDKKDYSKLIKEINIICKLDWID